MKVDVVVHTRPMLAMETWQHVNDSLKILVLPVLVFVLRDPLGKLLVKLESLQLPFLTARFTKSQQDGGTDDDEGTSDSEPPVVTRGE